MQPFVRPSFAACTQRPYKPCVLHPGAVGQRALRHRRARCAAVAPQRAADRTAPRRTRRTQRRLRALLLPQAPGAAAMEPASAPAAAGAVDNPHAGKTPVTMLSGFLGAGALRRPLPGAAAKGGRRSHPPRPLRRSLRRNRRAHPPHASSTPHHAANTLPPTHPPSTPSPPTNTSTRSRQDHPAALPAGEQHREDRVHRERRRLNQHRRKGAPPPPGALLRARKHPLTGRGCRPSALPAGGMCARPGGAAPRPPGPFIV